MKTSGKNKKFKIGRIDTAHKAVFFVGVMTQQAPEAPADLLDIRKQDDADYHPTREEL